MDLCPRCQGGAIEAPNCPVCGGSGFVRDPQGQTLSTAIPSPFRKTSTQTRQAREAEKHRKVKVLPVRMTPAERRQAEKEAFSAKCEAMRRRRAAELKREKDARERAPVEFSTTPEGTVVKSTYRKNNKSVDAGRHPQAPVSRKVHLSNQSTPEQSRRGKKRTEQPPRVSKEAQSAMAVRNTALADQLAALKGQLAPAPGPAAPQQPEVKDEPVRLESSSMSALEAKKRPQGKRPKSRKTLSVSDNQIQKSQEGKFLRVNNGKLTRASKSLIEGHSETRLVTMESPRMGRVTWPYGDTSEASTDEEDQGAAVLFEPRQREEDGGRYMGHSFRDRDGSFGSMPVYDNLDEYDE